MPLKKSTVPKNSPRAPVQTRGIQTRDKIMEAGRRLFTLKGFHNILADDVAREAGVSVGSFYGYFKDKRDLFIAILKHDSEVMLSGATAHLATITENKNMDIEALIRQTLQILVEAHRDILSMHEEAQQLALFDQGFGEYLRWSNQASQQVFEHVLIHIKPDLDTESLHAMSYVLYHTSEGIIHSLAGHNQSDTDQDKIISETTKLFSAYFHAFYQN